MDKADRINLMNNDNIKIFSSYDNSHYVSTIQHGNQYSRSKLDVHILHKCPSNKGHKFFFVDLDINQVNISYRQHYRLQIGITHIFMDIELLFHLEKCNF